jgi:3-dehydroquinate dehydratase-2
MNATNSRICIINGPNLNLLGVREPSVYGSKSFEDYFILLKQEFTSFELEYFQSNVEGEIINKLHQCGFDGMGIILNAGGYSHTSVAIADAVAAITTPVVEVHISNIYKREEYRHHSLIASKSEGVICGFGLDSYRLAMEYFKGKLNKE